MLYNLIQLSLLALLPLTAFAGHGSHFQRTHRPHDIALRSEGNVGLYKRQGFQNTKWSYYDVQESGNAGSCGRHHVNSDFTVAMNVAQMNSGLCFRTIRMNYNGRTAIATISDTCPGCPFGGLDLTPALFRYFVEPQSIEQVGILWTGSWEFADGTPGGGAPPPPPPPPPPIPTPTPPPPPPSMTSTSTTQSSSTTSTSTVVSSTGTAGNSTVTATSTTSINYSSGVASGLVSPSGTMNISDGESNNLLWLSQAFVKIGAVAVVGHN